MGHATLINAIALATPTYTMTNFQIPKDLCEELDASIRKSGGTQKIAQAIISPQWLGNTYVNQRIKEV